MEQERSRSNYFLSMTNFSFIKSPVFWSNVVMVLFLFGGAVLKVYPSLAWLNAVVVGLNFILTQYFHKSAVVAAGER